MKYKVGDKVKIREDLIAEGDYGGDRFVSEMVPWRGQVVTIEHVRCAEGYYLLKGDDNWCWTDEMIEGLVSEASNDTVNHPSQQRMSEKEPEQILEKVFELLRGLEKVKVKGERPIPIVNDRRKDPANECTLKEWIQKLNEEVDELKNELLSAYLFEEIPCLREPGLNDETKRLIVGELCDVIEVLYSMANQMGIDGDMIQAGIAETNKKLRERGCI